MILSGNSVALDMGEGFVLTQSNQEHKNQVIYDFESLAHSETEYERLLRDAEKFDKRSGTFTMVGGIAFLVGILYAVGSQEEDEYGNLEYGDESMKGVGLALTGLLGGGALSAYYSNKSRESKRKADEVSKTITLRSTGESYLLSVGIRF